MKTKTLKNPILLIFISLFLVFSLVSISITAEPVNAAITAVSVTTPTTGSPAYAKTGGSVTVTFSVSYDAADTADFIINILEAGTSNIVATTNINSVAVSSSPQSFSYPIALTGVATGTYDVTVGARQPTGSGTYLYATANSNAVVVDNTAPVVTLTNPNGGNYVLSDAAYTISWNATDTTPAGANLTVTAKYSIDGGASWTATNIVGVSKAQGVNSASWTASNIPDGDYSTAKIQLTVVDAAGNQTVVASASNFYILNSSPTVSISIPNGSTSWNGGSTQSITFTTTSAFNLNVDYWLEFNNGSGWSTITPGTGGYVTNQPVGLTTYSWTVNNAYRGSSAEIKATVRDKAGRVGAASTSPAFTILDVTAPTVTMVSPEAGDKVYDSQATTIDWTATDNVAGTLTYYWYLSTDGGSTWQQLGTTTAAQGANSQAWTPSVTQTMTNCKIKVTATDAATTPNTGQAISSTFSIIYGGGTATVVTMVSPVGGETWQGGTCHAITWTASDPVDATGTLDYTLEYSDDGGGTWTTIAVLTERDQGSNTFCWAVPTTADTDYQVQVTADSPSGGTGSDASDDFAVTTADTAVEPATLNLKQGWNLVSLELMPVVCPSTSTSYSCSYPIESVLADCLDRIESVWYYPQGVGTTWLHWAPGVPSSLTAMTDGKAYWIYISAGVDTSATYLGRKGPAGGGFPTTPYQYYVGWNQVGFKSTSDKEVQTYLGGTPGTTYIVPIYGWDAGLQAWTTLAADDDMTSGDGYWVYFNVAHTVNAGAD
jgi:hypothetical protein